jgi:hypothetical protein
VTVHRQQEPAPQPGRTDARAPALDAFFEWYYRTNPVSATFIGVHEHDSRLPDCSEHGLGDALAGVEALRARFRDLPTESRQDADALDQTLAQGQLDVFRWELTSHHFHRANPCFYTGEAIFGVLSLFLRPFAPVALRADAAVERMMAIPTLLAQGRRHLREAPRLWTERAIRECTGALAFFERGVETLIHAEGIVHPRFRAAAAVAAAAFREFQAYLASDLLRHASEEYACGAETLRLLLRRGHHVDTAAEEIAGLAMEHAARWKDYMKRRATEVAAFDWREALDRLAEQHASASGYYGRYAEIWQEARAAAERHRLVSWPDYPIRYVPQPAWAQEAAPFLYFLSYRAPAAFDRAPLVDYLVTPVEPDMPEAEQTRRLRAANDSVIKLNHVTHHGGLGHHVQNWYAYHRARSRIGRMAAVDCASRIALFCGGTMAEGWACYATDLMDEIGFLDRNERIAHAQTHLRMAARALVDVRLHDGEWTLEQAAAFYRDRAGMTSDAARAEAVKNSLFPGTALMYLVGTELIHRLRRDLARRKGFDLRRFHDGLLSYGSVPVSLIGAAMREGRP